MTLATCSRSRSMDVERTSTSFAFTTFRPSGRSHALLRRHSEGSVDAIRIEDIHLAAVAQRESRRLENLVELYVHDLSDVFDIEIGEDGRFGYEKLPLYWM